MKTIMYKLSTQFWKCLFKRNLSQWANNKVLHFVTYQSRRSVSYKSSMFNLQNASRAEVKEFLGTFDTVLTDCDGVLWKYDNVIPGSQDTINYFRKIGKRIYFVTNNANKIRSEYVSKAKKMGFVAYEEEVLSAAYLVAHYLKSIGFKKKAYILGAKSIGEELNAVGIRHTGIGPDRIKQHYMSMKVSDLDPEVGAVVVSFDEDVNYVKLMKVASYLTSEECLFIATNTDETYPIGGSIVMPAAGAFVKAIEFCTKRKAFVVGKPYEYVQKYLQSYNLKPARTLMIGDNCSTDVELGVRCGFQTLLVLSGVTSNKFIENLRCTRTPPIPDVILPKLGDLMPLVSS